VASCNTASPVVTWHLAAKAACIGRRSVVTTHDTARLRLSSFPKLGVFLFTHVAWPIVSAIIPHCGGADMNSTRRTILLEQTFMAVCNCLISELLVLTKTWKIGCHKVEPCELSVLQSSLCCRPELHAPAPPAPWSQQPGAGAAMRAPAVAAVCTEAVTSCKLLGPHPAVCATEARLHVTSLRTAQLLKWRHRCCGVAEKCMCTPQKRTVGCNLPAGCDAGTRPLQASLPRPALDASQHCPSTSGAQRAIPRTLTLGLSNCIRAPDSVHCTRASARKSHSRLQALTAESGRLESIREPLEPIRETSARPRLQCEPPRSAGR
jgi:hypothetical protein